MNKKIQYNLKSLLIPTAIVLLALNFVSCKGSDSGEESDVQYKKTETYDHVRNGARLILKYDSDTQSFTGTVENTTDTTLHQVRVEVHLSNGKELGPTSPRDLAPGEKIPVTLEATGEKFTTWGAHPEVGAEEHEHGSGSEGGEGSGEHGSGSEGSGG